MKQERERIAVMEVEPPSGSYSGSGLLKNEEGEETMAIEKLWSSAL